MSTINETSPFDDVFGDANVQESLFKRAFEIVREKKNKKEDDNISIADVLLVFLEDKLDETDKISLGWTAICMIRQSQNKMEFTDEETNRLIDNIKKELKIYLEKN